MTIDIPPPPTILPERIADLELRWQDSLAQVAGRLYPESAHSDDAHAVLTHESQADFVREPGKRLLIGIAGPGAAGKGTLGRYLSEALDFNKVVNTTTRLPREGERHGIDYHFVEPGQFSREQNLGRYALSLERIGRGMYGIAHQEIEEKLAAATTGCIFEESPENIMKLFANFTNPTTQAALLYILPPPPVIANSLAHLQHRLSLEADPAKRILTPEVFESTLGDRQVDEFLALQQLPNHPNITPLFIVNDDLEAAKERLATMLGDSDAAA